MALDSLASTADLPTSWQSDPDAETALLVASAAVRDAAGSAISVLTSTVTVTGTGSRLLRLPGPVTAVSAVTIDEDVLTSDDYRVLPEGLWRHCGWTSDGGPVPVAVTMTHGLVAVPADVKDLCVQLAVAWLQHNQAGGGSTAGLKAASIDDASETYSDESSEQVSPVFIPSLTRTWLAARFGGGAAVVESV